MNEFVKKLIDMYLHAYSIIHVLVSWINWNKDYENLGSLVLLKRWIPVIVPKLIVRFRFNFLFSTYSIWYENLWFMPIKYILLDQLIKDWFIIGHNALIFSSTVPLFFHQILIFKINLRFHCFILKIVR